MSEVVISTIESKVAELQKFHKEKVDFLGQVNMNIEQLGNERTNVQKQLLEVSGAIQGYNESIRLLKGTMPAEPESIVVDAAAEVPEPIEA